MEFKGFSAFILSIFSMSFVLGHGEDSTASHHFLNIYVVDWFSSLDIVWKILILVVFMGIVLFVAWFMVNKVHE